VGWNEDKEHDATSAGRHTAATHRVALAWDGERPRGVARVACDARDERRGESGRMSGH
jgi:hypothetical protein